MPGWLRGPCFSADVRRLTPTLPCNPYASFPGPGFAPCNPGAGFRSPGVNPTTTGPGDTRPEYRPWYHNQPSSAPANHHNR